MLHIGCGKSTQIPQLIVRDCVNYIDVNDDMDLTNDSIINIIVTEPRRVAAVSVSARVSDELGDDLGPLSSAMCGYTVRLDSRVGPKCVIGES